MINIPVDKLQDKTSIGFQLKAFDTRYSAHEADNLGAHRDDHYIFFVITEGTGSIIVDFEEKIVSSNQLYYILPEQIHHRIKANQAKGWFVAVDPSLLDPECWNVFEGWSGFQEPVNLTHQDVNDFDNLLNILNGKMQNQGLYKMKVLHSLLRAFIEMAAGTVNVEFDINASNSRSIELSRRFRRLLNHNTDTYKRPSDYASALYVSEPYLNECIKKTTGSPVSFWIKYKT
jgi:AraC family transcriptional activator of pobA